MIKSVPVMHCQKSGMLGSKFQFIDFIFNF